MTLRKLHELIPWDERQIFRMQQGRAMRGKHSSDEWRSILANHRAAPPAPAVTIALTDDRILIDSLGEAGQLELGAIASGLTHLKVTNPIDRFDPLLPFRLYPLIGTDAFTRRNSWRRRVWRRPMEIARAGQSYPLGWDGLRATLAESLDQGRGRSYQVAEIARIAQAAIGATLEGQAAQDFWRANR